MLVYMNVKPLYLLNKLADHTMALWPSTDVTFTMAASFVLLMRVIIYRSNVLAPDN